MNREEVRARIMEIGIIPAVRVYCRGRCVCRRSSLRSRGPDCRVTMTVPGAVKVIYELARQNAGFVKPDRS